MGLFDGRAKTEALEQEIRERMSALPIFDQLVESLLADETQGWLTQCQSYYDSRKRKVSVEEDCFEIKWSSVQDEKYVDGNGQIRYRSVENVHGSVRYSFTKSGYLPLHSYCDERGKELVSANRIRNIWLGIVREKLLEKMPGCRFEELYSTTATSFEYTVPGLRFRDWF